MNSTILKDKSILLGWVLGLLILISLIWILTQHLMAHNLMRTVNNVFANNGDPRRVTENIHYNGGKAGLFGYWYSMYNSTNRMFVFTVFQDGIMLPLGAIVAANGSVEQIIPMSAHAEQAFENLPKSLLQMYITRIEETASGMEGKKR